MPTPDHPPRCPALPQRGAGRAPVLLLSLAGPPAGGAGSGSTPTLHCGSSRTPGIPKNRHWLQPLPVRWCPRAPPTAFPDRRTDAGSRQPPRGDPRTGLEPTPSDHPTPLRRSCPQAARGGLMCSCSCRRTHCRGRSGSIQTSTVDHEKHLSDLRHKGNPEHRPRAGVVQSVGTAGVPGPHPLPSRAVARRRVVPLAERRPPVPTQATHKRKLPPAPADPPIGAAPEAGNSAPAPGPRELPLRSDGTGGTPLSG